MEQTYQRTVATDQMELAFTASVVGQTSLRHMADSVPLTYFDIDRLMNQLHGPRTQTRLDPATGLNSLFHGYSSRSSLQNAQPTSTGSDTALELVESWYQSFTTELQQEYGRLGQSMGALQSTLCPSAVLEQCGTIPDEAARLLYARTFLARRGVPKQDTEWLLSLVPLSDCTTYKHLRQQLKNVSMFFAYSGGLTPIRRDAMHGSNLDAHVVCSD